MRRMRHLKPREIQGCDIAFQFWRPETLFDATSGGSAVGSGGSIARAEDVSGNGNHATQSTGASQPTRQIAAQNGMDAARFDGSNDYLNAGDVADTRTNPIDAYACFIRTGSYGFKGVFGKSRATASHGRWSFLLEYGDDGMVSNDSTGYGSNATLATSAALQLLHLSATRTGTNSQTLRRNESTSITVSPSVSATDLNSVDLVMIGCYQNATGTAPLSGSYIGADILECGKFSRLLSDESRKRLQHSIMRRMRISG